MIDKRPNPTASWYRATSRRKRQPAHCAFAFAAGCPRYYQSISVLAGAGFAKLDPADDEALYDHWRRTGLWPVAPEEETSVSLKGEPPMQRAFAYSHFCPEVLGERFGLFCSDLWKQTDDEIDQEARDRHFARAGVPLDAPERQWSIFAALHFTDCRYFSILSSQVGATSTATPRPPIANDVSRQHRSSPTGAPMNDADTPPVVFISYSHDSAVHEARVLALAQRLRGDGLDCRIDRFVSGGPAEGWPLWMERQIAAARHVLVVCSPTYLRRYDGTEPAGVGLGATWEAVLARQDLYEGQGVNKKFVPVLFDGASTAEVPKPLRPFTRYHLDAGYDALYRYLTEQPATIPDPIGRKRVMPPDPP